jgi:hypothetical protein
MRQKLDIADVEERTKIRAKYLRALENEEWSLLPGPTFVKTFLRTYAEVVGVDPYLLVEEYRVNHERHDEPEFQPLASPARDSRRGSRRPPPPGPPRRGLIVGGLLVALIAFLLALGLLGGEDDGGDGGSDTTPTQASTSEQPGKRQRSQQPAPKPAAGVTVRIAPIEPTYACVDSGPGTDVSFEGTLDAAQTFRNPKLLRINLGKRSAAITANGKPVQVTESAEPLGLEIRPGGTTDISSEDRPCA